MAKIVGIKFKYAGKIYYFDPKGETFEEGSGVIVETAKGLEYGTVALPVREVPDFAIGMHCLGCPSSRGETVEEACMVHGIECDSFLAQLNHFLEAYEADQAEKNA